MRPSYSGTDMVLADSIGLNLYREGKAPSVQGGRWGASEAVKASGGVEHAVPLERLDGGIGSSERLIPDTYALAIDGCTRFGNTWTPAGEKIAIGSLPIGAGPGGAYTRVAGEIRAMYTDGDDLLVGAGGVLYRLSYPYVAAVPEIAVDPTEEIQDILRFEGTLVMGTRLVADGSPGRLWVKSGSTWFRSVTANRQHLCLVYMTINDLGAWRIVSNDTPYTFRFLATGGGSITPSLLLDDSAWIGSGGQYPVGDATAPITNMAGAPLVMFFSKTDGIYHIGPTGRSERIADWSDSVHPDNGKALYFSYGGLFASHERWGLVRIEVANQQVQWQTNACAPGTGLPRITPINGANTALTMDGEWLVDSVYNGTDSFVCYLRPKELAAREAMGNLTSPQSMNCHGSEATFWGERVTCLEQATIGTDKRPLLWVGTMQGSTPALYNVSLPKLGTPLEDWIQGGPHRFTTQSWLYYPRQDWGEANVGRLEGWASARKVFNGVDLSGEYVSRYTTWIDAYMATNEGHQIFWDRALDPDATLWTQVGRYDDGERVSLTPGASVQSGVRAGLMLRGYGERDKPFALYGVKLRGTPLIEQSERRQYRCVIGAATKANKARDRRDRLFQLNQMWALQWSDPVPLQDHLRMPLVVQIEPTMSYQDVTDTSTGNVTTVVTFTCRIIRRPFVWGAGFRWGTNITWS